MYTSVSWWLNHIKFNHPEHLQVARWKNLTICSAAHCVKRAKLGEFNPNKDSVEERAAFPYREHVEIITDSESESLPPPLPLTEIYPGASAQFSDYIA